MSETNKRSLRSLQVFGNRAIPNPVNKQLSDRRVLGEFSELFSQLPVRIGIGSTHRPANPSMFPFNHCTSQNFGIL
jgi:hypothetical protein